MRDIVFTFLSDANGAAAHSTSQRIRSGGDQVRGLFLSHN